MLVFRKTQLRISGEAVRRDLVARITRAVRDPSREALLPLLLRAGEVEAALEDAEHASASAARELTSAAARALAENVAWLTVPSFRHLAETIELPAELVLRRPEGFAYYALDPDDYSHVAREFAPRSRRVTVIGIRSIGTSLSAAVSAAFGARGFNVQRATVRPSGHPWDRRTIPDTYAEQIICAGRGGDFIVVDEGPGLSGSSFLSVGEALELQGVSANSVTFLCSRRVDPTRLVAQDAEHRWRRFGCVITEARPKKTDSEVDLCAGRWRSFSASGRESCPPSWLMRERSKYLSRDTGELRRFVGYAPYGEHAAQRAELLSLAGFSPETFGYSAGYLHQRWEYGRYFPFAGVRPVERIAEYVGFRARAFPVRTVTGGLDEMLRNNVREVTGTDLAGSARLQVVTPVVCDGALAPHEWLLCEDGRILKTDSSDHGDDHLYPGPCDAAWDLAGAVIEWGFDAVERRRLLDVYRRTTGDDATERLPAYELAYAAFRIGCMRMAKLDASSEDSAGLSELESLYERHLRARLPQFVETTPKRRNLSA